MDKDVDDRNLAAELDLASAAKYTDGPSPAPDGSHSIADSDDFPTITNLNSTLSLSPFAAKILVYAFYDIIFGRTAEDAGVEVWVAAINNGVSLVNIANIILSSPEYMHTSDDTRRLFEEGKDQVCVDVLSRSRELVASIKRIFDADYYKIEYPHSWRESTSSFEHFISHGLFAGLSPNRIFDPKWYLSNYNDIETNGVNPLMHYITMGWREGRDPGPDFCTSAYLEIRRESLNGVNEPLGVYMANDVDDPDVHLALGHAHLRRGRIDNAVSAYQRSFQLSPMRGAMLGLRTLNVATKNPNDCMRNEAKSCLWLEVGDLLTVMSGQAVVSGIQRVQFGIISYVLNHKNEQSTDVSFVCWYCDELWELPRPRLKAVVDHYQRTGGSAFGEQKELISTLLDHSVFVQPAPGDTFVSTGVVYFEADLVRARERLRRNKVRLGLAIYDFIPLSNPEFCHLNLIDQFSPSMAEALLQVDFAVTISEFVARETRRLMAAAGYPQVAVRAVPLARVLEDDPIKTDPDAWTSKIGGLRDSEFVLCVSTLHSHKNHIFLLRVWLLLAQEGISLPKLVFAGRRSHGVDDLFHQLESSRNLSGRVVVVDGPTDAEITLLYSRSLFTMFASFVEGWGLPVGESLARGKVCLASKTTSIPEVGGNLALYFDPYNVREAANIVRDLLLDRNTLAALEQKVRKEFRSRDWDDYGRDFVKTVTILSEGVAAEGGLGQAGPWLSLGKILSLRRAPERWQFGTSLPPTAAMQDIVLPRLVLAQGWHKIEDLGATMSGTSAELCLPVDCPITTKLRVLLKFRAHRKGDSARLTITADAMPPISSAPPFDTRCDFFMQIDCIVNHTQRIHLNVASSHSGAFELLAIECKLYSASEDELPSLQLLRPVALVGPNWRAMPPISAKAVKVALQRRAMLRDGWAEPEAWGTWMLGHSASIAFTMAPNHARRCRVVLRLRIAPSARHMNIEVSSTLCASRACTSAASIFVALDCRATDEGLVSLDLRLSGDPEAGDVGPYVGLESFIYSHAANDHDRLKLIETIVFESTDGQAAHDGALICESVNFNVTGHVNGAYSLANVNRKMALSLESARPGSVRLSQVEVKPTHDLSMVPAYQFEKIAELALRRAPADRPEILISQHWPVWEPPKADFPPLAFAFWEEGTAPPAMVEALNRSFAAVLAPSRFVAKVLRDSGVRVPIKNVGFAPDLASFAALGAARLSMIRPAVDASAPFTFLHVSSCFPRKGVDILLKAYAETFTSRDAVRLVIKTFPNQHNDVAGQISLLKQTVQNLPAITLIDEEISNDRLLSLYKQSDAMVLPTRGEGYNIPAAEALAAGLLLIVTGFGAHLDFLDGSVARLIDFEFAASRSHLKSYGSTWVNPQLQDLKSALLETYKKDASLSRKRVEAGYAAVKSIANSDDWAHRVESAAYAALTASDQQAQIKVAWVSTWDVRCGIADYSRMLLDAYRYAARDVIVLCDSRTPSIGKESSSKPEVRIGWQDAYDFSCSKLANNIKATDCGVVLIQHHKAQIFWPDLAQLLSHRNMQHRAVIVLLHNVQEILGEDHPDHALLITGLKGADRVLVHTPNDLNILKQHGLVDNTALFPHGTPTARLAPQVARPLPPNSTPLVGAYGYMLPHKGFASLIRAFAILRMEWPNMRLRLVTAEYPISLSAEALQDCREVARSLNLEQAIEWHTDYLATDRSLVLLNECDAIVLPYQATPESSSAAVRTALAAAAPVVVTPLGIFDDVEDAVLRLHGTDVQSIAGGVSWLLHEQTVRSDLQRQAAAWQTANSWDAVAERLRNMIAGIAADRKERETDGYIETKLANAEARQLAQSA